MVNKSTNMQLYNESKQQNKNFKFTTQKLMWLFIYFLTN